MVISKLMALEMRINIWLLACWTYFVHLKE